MADAPLAAYRSAISKALRGDPGLLSALGSKPALVQSLANIALERPKQEEATQKLVRAFSVQDNVEDAPTLIFSPQQVCTLPHNTLDKNKYKPNSYTLNPKKRATKNMQHIWALDSGNTMWGGMASHHVLAETRLCVLQLLTGLTRIFFIVGAADLACSGPQK